MLLGPHLVLCCDPDSVRFAGGSCEKLLVPQGFSVGGEELFLEVFLLVY